MEAETGASLLTITGGLVISRRKRGVRTHVPDFFANTLLAARTYNIAHELLDAPAIRERFPQFHVRDDELGYSRLIHSPSSFLNATYY